MAKQIPLSDTEKRMLYDRKNYDLNQKKIYDDNYRLCKGWADKWGNLIIVNKNSILENILTENKRGAKSIMLHYDDLLNLKWYDVAPYHTVKKSSEKLFIELLNKLHMPKIRDCLQIQSLQIVPYSSLSCYSPTVYIVLEWFKSKSLILYQTVNDKCNSCNEFSKQNE
jgi:hypothetical protein